MSIQSRRNRLFDLEIDEVSAVDRPASQRGLISIAKSLGQEDAMPEQDQLTFDIPADVAHGDTVVAEDGSEYIYLEVDDAGDPLPLDGVDTDDLVASADTVFDLSDAGAEDEASQYADFGKAGVGSAFNAARKLGAAGKDLPAPAKVASKIGTPVSDQAEKLGHLAGRGEGWVRKNPLKAAAITGGAGVAGGGAYMVAQKSLGTTVLEELSKAVSAEERDQIVAKMADEVERTSAENEELRKAFEEERDIRITEAFVAKAAEYELPVDPEVFGPILKAIAEVLDDHELDVLDTVLSSRGVSMDELGYAGGASNSGVLDEISGLAGELVGKAAGNVSTEQAVTALFENNPSAYDAYLAENGR